MTKVDLLTQEITDALNNSYVYTKVGTVVAERMNSKTRIETIVADGFLETVNDAEPGDYLVTNPTGEKYVLKPDVFNKRYESTQEYQVWKAVGLIRAIPSPFNTDIEIDAPWGETQRGKANCMIATAIENDFDEAGEERYIIEAEAFLATYMRL